MDQRNLIDISQFIVVASTLILMKAKSLLPGVTYTEEEEKQVEDLEKKLELYKMVSKAALCIKAIYAKSPLYTKERSAFTSGSLFVPDKRVDTKLLLSVAELTLASYVSPKALVKVAVEQALRIENVIESLLDRVKNMQGSTTLRSLAGGAKTEEEQKKVLIVNFIALLELLRSGGIHAEQSVDGGDITIQSL